MNEYEKWKGQEGDFGSLLKNANTLSGKPKLWMAVIYKCLVINGFIFFSNLDINEFRVILIKF